MTLPFIPEPGYRYFYHVDRDTYYRLGRSPYDTCRWSSSRGSWVPTTAEHSNIKALCVPVAGPKPLDDWRPTWAVMGRY